MYFTPSENIYTLRLFSCFPVTSDLYESYKSDSL